MPCKRVICAFQPHTYTRTKALFHEFVEELKLPDVTILAEIYAARENNDISISSNDLAREIPAQSTALRWIRWPISWPALPAPGPDSDGGRR